MDTNPYESPRDAAVSSAEPARRTAIHVRLIRGMTRGALIGAAFGLVGGVAILLVLGLWIRTPVLTGDVASATRTNLVFMAYSVVSTTTVGTVGSALASLRPARRGDGSRQR